MALKLDTLGYNPLKIIHDVAILPLFALIFI